MAEGPSHPSSQDDDRLESYDYALDPSRIASAPAAQRDQSRLLVVERTGDRLQHASFSDLSSLLSPGDVVVVNDARVVAARLQARRRSGAAVEVLLHPTGVAEARLDQRWQALALLHPSRRIRQGEELDLPGGAVLRVEDPPGRELRRVSSAARWEEVLRDGRIPLPPYLPRPEGEKPEDRDRYQTIFAERPGAVAAPTAGLHFTPELVERLKVRGIELVRLTLFVGPGTFLPVRSARLSQHEMHEEAYEVPSATRAAIARARANGHRVVAVGTTTTRALEASVDDAGLPREGKGRTCLMIRPSHQFRSIDALITNFHLPRSTLLALVSAFAGRERVLRWYQLAADEGYRFYSYGDAMLIL